MNRLTSTTIDRIIDFMSEMKESDKQTPLRLVNIGYDIYKEPGLKDYRMMTVGQFLSVLAGHENIPRKLSNIVETLISTMSLSTKQEQSVEPTLVSKSQNVIELPANSNKPFFEQAVEVIDTLLTAMSTLNKPQKKNSERIRLAFTSGMTDTEIGHATDVTNERVRQIREEFQSRLKAGIVQKELKAEYVISPSFIEEARRISLVIENQTTDFIKSNFGEICESQFQFVIKTFGFKILKANNKEFVVKEENRDRFYQLTKDIRISLKKEFDFVSMTSLIDHTDDDALSFLISFMSSQPECYEFHENKKFVRMVGSGLSKITRLARIIFEAGDWIDKDSIAAIYTQQYEGDVPHLNPVALAALGFAPQNRTGKWKFGSVPTKIQDLIRSIITPERPLVTFKTILTATAKSGMDYPESTIRAYITDIATPENTQNDLFCLKGYCHKYPNYSWRRYRKALA